MKKRSEKMKKEFLVLMILASLVLVMGMNGCSNKNTNSQGETANSTKMVDCGELTNPTCFSNRMNTCLPVTAKLTGNDGSSIDLTILGVENETCHFQRKINGTLDLDCYFPKGTLSFDTIGQTLGDDKGLQDVVDNACKSVGW